MQLDNSTDDDKRIYEYARLLSDKLLLGENGLFIKGEVIRLVGVGVSKLDDGSFRQLSLFDVMKTASNANAKADGDLAFEKQKKLDKMTEELDSRFGKNTIIKGSSL